MLTADSRLRPNHAEVAAKVMDGEAILINISNGMYHSMEHVGGTAWELIAEGHKLREIAEVLAARYDAAVSTIEEDLIELANALLAESLVLETDDAVDAPPTPPAGDKQPYIKPALKTYKDMNDLLALDPPMPGLQEIPWDENG